MNRNLFTETCRYDLPSTSTHNGSIERHVIHEDFNGDENVQQTFKLKLATKNHALEIISSSNLVDDHSNNFLNGLNISTTSLPTPTKDSVEKVFEVSDSFERECISHSYLNLSSSEHDTVNHSNKSRGRYFIEAFILKINVLSMDDAQQSISNNIMLNASQSSSVLEKKRDDQTLSYLENSSKVAPTITAGTIENEYHLVVRANLPSSYSNIEEKLTKMLNVDNSDLIDEGIIDEEETSSNIKTDIPIKTKTKADTKNKGHKSRKKKKKKKNSIYTHCSSVPISSKSTLVKICKTDIDDSSEDCTTKKKILPIGIFIVEGTNLIHYQISTKTQDQIEINSIAKGIRSSIPTMTCLNIIKKSILVEKSVTKNISHGDEFVSMLLEEPSIDQSDESEINILEFSSQIKALDTIHVNDSNNRGNTTVVAGCENGLVRLFCFSSSSNTGSEDLTYIVQRSNEFRVDGIVNVVYLTLCKEKTSVDLIIGTSFGYACLSSDPLNIDQPFYQEPLMLMEGIWNPKSREDDVVRSVCKIPTLERNTNKTIYALGTQSGHVFLVGKDDDKDGNTSEFTCLWYISLYHPINAITFALNYESVPILLVITKETIHWFSLDSSSNGILSKSQLEDGTELNKQNNDEEGIAAF